MKKPQAQRAHVYALVFALVANTVWAQTKVTAPKNGFSPEQDVQIGQQAAAEVRQQMPLLRDGDAQQYVERIGRRLVEAIPAPYQQPKFDYTFQVVNARDINAFALPGGPTFFNRGLLTAAKTEGEVAGVIAHELSHVILRHGTAQATKAQKYQIGQVAGQIIGAIVGGTAGAVIAQGSQFGLGTAFLRYSREYEKQADLLGAQIMARAGYDPRDMASMFKTIEQQSKSQGPQWLSDHPNPGNRYSYITKEAQSLRVENPIRDTGELRSVQAELSQMPQAPTTEQLMRNAQRGGVSGNTGEPGATGTSGRISRNVEPPSSQFRTFTAGDVFRVSVPENWREATSESSVRFAPEGAFASSGGQEVFTHGVQLGVANADGANLQQATDLLIEAFQQGNPRLSREGRYESVSFAGRRGLRTVLRNVSDATGESETILLQTALIDQGTVLYSIGVAPSNEFNAYARTLQQVNQSVEIRR